MKRALKCLVGAAALLAYELLLDGSGIGIKQRWAQIKKWAQQSSHSADFKKG